MLATVVKCSMPNSCQNKVLVVGIDAATFDLIRPLTQQGKLQTLKKIMDEGVSGELRSTIPPLTAPAWTSMVTGKNPGKHGIFDFTKRKKGSYEEAVQSSLNRDAETIWNIVGRKNKKVVVINVPLTYPPEKVNGALISGIPAPESGNDFVFPKQLLDEIEREVGEYRIWYKVEPGEKSAISFTRDIEQLIELRGQVARYLMKNKEWDFFMVNFQSLDWVQHFYWKYMNKDGFENGLGSKSKCSHVIENTYTRIDEQLSKILEIIEEDTYLFIVSDHGAGPLKKNVYLNNWFAATDLLVYKKSTKYLLHKIGFTSENIYKLIAKSRLANLVPKLREKKNFILHRFLTTNDVDWSKTQAYSIGLDGNIFINLKGREPQGVIEPGKEYEEVRRYLIQNLQKLKDPETDELIFDEVYLREEIFDGPHLSEAPDILLLLTRYHQDVKFVSKKLIGPPPDNISANHRMNGIMIIKGPNIKHGSLLKGANILDVAPTILHTMGFPIPNDMDGKLLADAFVD